MITRSTLFKTTVIIALLATATLWSADRAGAFTLIEREIFFPDLGITRGQTARINVSNLSDSRLSFSWSVFDNNGVNHLPPTELAKTLIELRVQKDTPVFTDDHAPLEDMTRRMAPAVHRGR